MAEPIGLKYRAFISYSHTDTSWAKWLHGKLEGFPIDKDLVGRETATGAIPKTLRPIFRDRDDFTAGHTLSEQTLEALADILTAATRVQKRPTLRKVGRSDLAQSSRREGNRRLGHVRLTGGLPTKMTRPANFVASL